MAYVSRKPLRDSHSKGRSRKGLPGLKVSGSRLDVPSLSRVTSARLHHKVEPLFRGMDSAGEEQPEIRSKGGHRPGCSCKLRVPETQENHEPAPQAEPDSTRKKEQLTVG